jgi:hypothetical protein
MSFSCLGILFKITSISICVLTFIIVNHIFFTYLPVDGQLDCFQVCAIMSNTAIHIHVQKLVLTNVFFSLGQIPRRGILRLLVTIQCI